jgi:uncharacterized protein
VQGEDHRPSKERALIYLNANPSLDSILGKIEPMGRAIQMPKTHITPEIGYMAIFTDTEGNRIALHSQN